MRFFVSQDNITEEQVIITGEDLKHMKVLRLEPGDIIEVCDGQGWDYSCRLLEITGDRALAAIVTKGENRAEPKVRITLYQGLPKSDKMDLIVQKCTEIGVARIVPVTTQRTVVQLNAKKAQQRRERWERIATAAAKQSGRGRIPQVGPVMSWQAALTDAQELRSQVGSERFGAVIPYELENTVFVGTVFRRWREQAVLEVAIFIGPEGGFAEEEVTQAQDIGAHSVSLGPRILRTETAGLITAGCLLYEMEQ
ncbi:MAG: 16S rRNA (uracil(1498)-N(3))-methyltransferase [Firmicutes bacterium]|nr:16S rRNA (uracil(1498)-N(3))-methyltransferase [Bacillota bacterium]